MATILFLLGIAFLSMGIYVRLGGFKSLYLAKGIPILMPRALQNFAMPLGLTLIATATTSSQILFPSVETRQQLTLWVEMPIFVIGLILVAWAPRWLKPRWLVYLEDEYGTVMWHLLDEAKKDVRGWSRRVRTQAGLEEWAEETRKKLGYPPHPGQIEREAKELERKNRY